MKGKFIIPNVLSVFFYIATAHAGIEEGKASNKSCGDHGCSEQIAVTAKIGSPAVPGAIVCKNYDTVDMMIELYINSWGDNLRASIRGAERERLIHGDPSSAPDLKKYGCVLFPPGTPMMWEGSWMPPVVTVKLSNGKTIRGVTNVSMIKIGKE